jgi:hypothetical protein
VRRQITLRNPANYSGPPSFDADDGESHFPPLRRTYSRAGTFKKAVDKTKTSVKEFWQWLQTPVAKGVIKASLAYLLGSMATFVPFIANFLGKQDGKHIVATVTVYFNPARSVGSMMEGALLGLAAFAYATFISIASMATSVFFETQVDQIEVAYVLVVVVFCGGGLGFVGWLKQRFNSPLTSVAASLASIAIITVLTKENAIVTGVFSDDKIVQVLKMVVMGLTASFLVSLLVWPVSARTELRETMIKTTDSLSSMLTMITRGFLSGSESDLRSSSFNRALSQYKSVFTQMTKNLREAKFEHYVLGREEQCKLETRLVNCMQTLAQSIGGLRSAAATQFALLRESANGGSTPYSASFSIPKMHGSMSSAARQDRFAILTAIEEASEEGSGGEDSQEIPRPVARQGSNASSLLPTVRTPSEIFSQFIMQLGPSMKSLAYTLSQILDELPFGEGPTYAITINDNFQSSLTEAV